MVISDLNNERGSQLTIPVSDSGSLSLTNTVSEHRYQAIQKFLNSGDHEPIACVTKYSPGRRKAEYYRLSYRVTSRKVKHIHIPGGNVNSRLAKYRAMRLQDLIDRGAEMGEVLAALSTYRGKNI